MTARTSFLPRLFIIVGLAGASSVVVACGGHIVSLGGTGDCSDKLSSVTPVTATASINNSSSSASGACPAGYVHPNICCEAGDGVVSQCGSWADDPLRACGSGWTTYPNALQCCNLNDPSDCIDTPADAGAGVPPPPPPIGCGFVCPPGWWSPPNDVVPVASSSSSSSGGPTTVGTNDPTSGGAAGSSSGGSTGSGSTSGSTGSGSTIGYGGGGGSCCTMLGDGTTYCTGWGYAEPVATTCGGSSSSSSGGGVVNPGGPILLDDGGSAAEDAGLPCGCSCPANDPSCVCDCVEDAGPAEDAGSSEWCDEDAGVTSYPPGYDGGVASLCGACPPGWLTSAIDPLLCCQTLADNLEECFSQATGSASGFSSGSSGGSSVPPSNGGSSTGSGSSSSGGGTVSSPPVSYPTDAGISSNGGN